MSYHFPINWTRNPLSVSGFDFDKLNDHEVRSLAILYSFHIMKVRDLLSLIEEEILSFLGNDYLFALHTTWDIIMYSANFFSHFSLRKNY